MTKNAREIAVTSAIFSALAVLSQLHIGGLGRALCGFLVISFLPGVGLVSILTRSSLKGADLYLHAAALSPLAVVCISIPVVAAGGGMWAAYAVVTVLSLACYVCAAILRSERREDQSVRPKTVMFAVGFALLIVIPVVVNSNLRFRSDAWFHAAVAERIMQGGIPPTDPFYAGIRLQYFWAYHVYLNVLNAACGCSWFNIMAAVNILFFILYLLAIYSVARDISRRRNGPLWAMMLAIFGINIIGWALLCGRSFFGDTRGAEILKGTLEGGTYSVLHAMSYRYMGSLSFFLDKFLTGSPFAMGLVMLLLYLHRAIKWLKTGHWIDLLLASFFCISAILFHTVVGFSLCIYGGAAFCFMIILGKAKRNPVQISRATRGLAALALSLCLCMPYLYTILSIRGSTGAFPLTFNTGFLWTVLAAGALPVFLTGLRFWRERALQEIEAFLIAILAAGFLLGTFARMPMGNANKFVYPVFLVLIVLSGDGACFLPGLFRRARLFSVLIIAGLAISGAATIAFGLWGFILDRGADIPVPISRGRVVLDEAVEEGYRWIGENTPRESIYLNGVRKDIPVLGPRRQLWTEGNFAIAWGYEQAEIEWRRKVLLKLCSGRLPDDNDLERLRAFGVPVYLVLRPENLKKSGDRDGGYPILEHYHPVFQNSEFTILLIVPGI